MKYLLPSENPKPKDNRNVNVKFSGRPTVNISEDSGFTRFKKIERTQILPGVFMEMHPPKNDKIFSYLRTGGLSNEDGSDMKVMITQTKVMMMDVGDVIHYQEPDLSKVVPVEMLQVVIRSSAPSHTSQCKVTDLETPFSVNEWRTIAGPDNAPLLIGSDIRIYDIRLHELTNKLYNNKENQYLLYVFSGSVKVDDNSLNVGDGIIYNNEELWVSAMESADLVLFELAPKISYIR